MITKLLKTSLLTLMITGISATAQIAGYDFDAFGFESQNVEWKTGNSGTVVEAWTQVAGFVQSDEQAKNGTYSMKADYSAVLATTPKLQTYRSNVNNEGKFEIQSTGDYIVSVWVYLTVLSSGTLKSTVQETSAGTYNATFDLSEVGQINTWTQLQAQINISTLGDSPTKFWTTLNFTSAPVSTIVYLDDLLVTKGSLIAKAEVLDNVSVYPNPAKENLNISAPAGSEITITNIAGVHVKSLQADSKNTKLSVSGLNSGIYIVKVVSEGKSYVTKVVVQ
ncbi:MAG: T9SS type A sorting domain-containing protein [Flavicella sp.]|nr:T9SS type A sorting domain-containing protein [Flavicella sp.]